MNAYRNIKNRFFNMHFVLSLRLYLGLSSAIIQVLQLQICTDSSLFLCMPHITDSLMTVTLCEDSSYEAPRYTIFTTFLLSPFHSVTVFL